jgi:hypothetical protein
MASPGLTFASLTIKSDLSGEFTQATALSAESISYAPVLSYTGLGMQLALSYEFVGVAPDLSYGSLSLEWELPTMPTSSSVYHAISVAGDNAASIKSVAGTLLGWAIYNNADYPIFVKLYDTVVVPNPAALEPKQTIGVEAGTASLMMPGLGIGYLNGIAIAIVAGIQDASNAGVEANDCCCDIFYQ